MSFTTRSLLASLLAAHAAGAGALVAHWPMDGSDAEQAVLNVSPAGLHGALRARRTPHGRSNDGVWAMSGHTLGPSGLRVTPTHVQIGGLNGAYPFNGLVDDVRLYNIALCKADLRALYSSTWRWRATSRLLVLRRTEGRSWCEAPVVVESLAFVPASRASHAPAT